MNEVSASLGEAVLQDVFILGGVLTLAKLKEILTKLESCYTQDISLRKEIIAGLRDATPNQMAVYVSTWKYSPLVDSSLELQLKEAFENE